MAYDLAYISWPMSQWPIFMQLTNPRAVQVDLMEKQKQYWDACGLLLLPSIQEAEGVPCHDGIMTEPG